MSNYSSKLRFFLLNDRIVEVKSISPIQQLSNITYYLGYSGLDDIDIRKQAISASYKMTHQRYLGDDLSNDALRLSWFFTIETPEGSVLCSKMYSTWEEAREAYGELFKYLRDGDCDGITV